MEYLREQIVNIGEHCSGLHFGLELDIYSTGLLKMI